MSDEPISVRIARAKGCAPAYYEAGRISSWAVWRCNCKAVGHHPNPALAVLVGPPEHEAWLQPAAVLTLLEEMPLAERILAVFGRPTLADAIARTWLSWKAAQR